jgi:phosphoadenosine phosphosulfate reductase
MSLTNLSAPEFSNEELAELSSDFESWSAEDIIGWGVETFAPHLSVTASMTDAVLIDLATKVFPAIEVVFIDTGYHFPETLETVERVRQRYGLNLRMMTVALQNEPLWQADPEGCCSAVKVGQLDRALSGKAAWMSGLRRAEADSRVNPIAMWSDEQVTNYIDQNNIIVNSLLLEGFTSIGCQPCTQKPTDPDDPRSGRWSGHSRTECGLHMM